MTPQLILVLLLFLHSNALQVCKTKDYCPPTTKETCTEVESGFEPLTIKIGKDEISGCTCRMNTMKPVVKCFGTEHCKRMPVNITITTPTLKMVFTNIEKVLKGHLDRFYNLTAFHLESSPNLHFIEPGSFKPMKSLIKLSLSFNINIKFLQPNLFEGLDTLQDLHLVENGFTTIYDATLALGPKVLPKIEFLSLNKNDFVVFPKDSFKAMSGTILKEFDCHLCRLEYLHPECFKPFKLVEVLRLGYNDFNDSVITAVVNKTLSYGMNLQLLNLYYDQFYKVPPRMLMNTISSSNISYLILARNRFEKITNESFPYMPNLLVLNLQESLVISISNNAFVNLPNLKTLILASNKLSTIPEGLLLPNLTYLDLSDNAQSSFFPTAYPSNKSQLTRLKKLIYFNLADNRLNAVHDYTFVGLSSLETLILRNSSVFYIENNTFAMLYSLKYLDLQRNYFVRSTPEIGIPTEIFRGLEKLETLGLNDCELKFISKFHNPFEYLQDLKNLSLGSNTISEISSADFKTLKNLEVLSLFSNCIKSWTKRVFEENKKLKSLDLSKNKISYISEAMLYDFENITDVNLEDNHFVCDCETYFSFRSLDNDQFERMLKKIDSHKTECHTPDQLINTTLKDYLYTVRKTSACDSNENQTKLGVIVPLLMMGVIFVTIVMFLYYYRHSVKYWVFLTRLYLIRRGKMRAKPSIEQGTYEYDAFVSYSTDDRNFVLRLVQMLENNSPFLKLCVYERDFQIGTIISESVVKSVEKSRKTLLVISDSFAKSTWCRWESQIAEHHRLFYENNHGEYIDDGLVLIKLGPVSLNHMTPTLKYLLKTRIYLAWDTDPEKQKVFWARLRSTLASVKTVSGQIP